MENKNRTNTPEITMEELVKMVNESSNEFVIHVELGGERDLDERNESVPI